MDLKVRSGCFESKGTCGTEQIPTSGSDSNEMVLEASCFDHGAKLTTNIYFKVDGSENYLYVVCNDTNKGTLILLGFRSVGNGP